MNLIGPLFIDHKHPPFDPLAHFCHSHIHGTDNNYMAMFTDVEIFEWMMIHPNLVSTLFTLSFLHYLFKSSLIKLTYRIVV